MIKINHITIFVISFIIFLGSILIDKKFKVDYQTKNIEYKDIDQISQEYKNLKRNWENKNLTDKKLDNIISSLKIKNITIDKKSRFINIKIENNDLKVLDKFLNKILNETFIIKSVYADKNKLELILGYN